jgi:hypothetical protein
MSHGKISATAHSKISLTTAAEQEFWCTYFGASTAELHTAVAAAGSYLVSVEDYLEARKQARAAA